MKRFYFMLIAATVLAAFLIVPVMAAASDKGDAQTTVTKANMTFNIFMSDKKFT